MILNTRKHSSIACNISPIPLSPRNCHSDLIDAFKETSTSPTLPYSNRLLYFVIYKAY